MFARISCDIDTGIQSGRRLMEKTRKVLELNPWESDALVRVTIPPHRVGIEPSFYEDLATRGIRVDRVEPGFISCTLKVPPRLTDGSGNLAFGAIAGLVDEVGAAAIQIPGQDMNVSIDMSIVHISAAKINEELEITSRALGQKGGYSGTAVLFRNKSTGEVVAEGRHSLFNKLASKL